MAIASYGAAASRSMSHSTAETAVAINNKMTSTSWNCAKNFRQAGVGACVRNSFGPY
jgi:hypothetical protein